MGVLSAAESYGYDTLLSAITPFYTQAMTQAGEIAANDKTISALAVNIRAMPAGAARDKAQAQLETISRPQAQIKLDRRAFATRWNSAINALNNWAAKAGIGAMGPPMLLSGLGIAPLVVPLAISAAIVLILVSGFLIYEHQKSVAVQKGATTLASIVGDASLTPAQKVAQLTAYDKAISDLAAAAGGSDFTNAIKSLTVPLLLVAAIYLLPKVLPARRAAA